MIPVRNFALNWRPKVLVTHKDFAEIGMKILAEKCDLSVCETLDRDEILTKSKGMDGIVWTTHSKLNAEACDAAGPQLKVVSTMSVGLDFVDLPELKRRNIQLGFTPHVLNDSVADIGIGLAIAASRRFLEGRRRIENSTWQSTLKFLLGHQLKNSTVGLVGFGGIGQAIARRLRGFEVAKILYCGHTEKPEAIKFNADFVPFFDLIERSDFVFIICPLTTETRSMFNADVFNRMKTTSVLINIARGDIIDQKALYEALKSNKIFAAGIDVMCPEPLPSDHPLMSLENCVITPHLGAASVTTRNDMAVVAAYNVLAGLSGEKLHSDAMEKME
jgi:glyoxylate/hydroxypyruvate reductase